MYNMLQILSINENPNLRAFHKILKCLTGHVHFYITILQVHVGMELYKCMLI